MKAHTNRMQGARLDHTFLALVLCLLGWALIEVWLLVLHARPALHIVLSLPALGIIGVSALRYRRYRQNAEYWLPSSAKGRRSVGMRDVAWAVAFLSMGGFLGVLVLGASTILLGAFTIGMWFIPWARVPSFAGNIAASCLLTLSGAGIVLAVGRHDISLMFLPIASWVLWAGALAAVFRQLGQTRSKECGSAAEVLGSRHG